MAKLHQTKTPPIQEQVLQAQASPSASESAEYMSNPWDFLDESRKDAEEISRKSLTYAQDCWFRLRRNKTSMLALCVIALMVLSAIFIPLFWGYSYEDQNLNFANIPPKLDIYQLDEDTYVYITKEYKAVLVSEKGDLLEMAQLVNDDKTNRIYRYEVGGKPLVIDYSIYFNARKEMQQLEALERKGKDILAGQVRFLQKYEHSWEKDDVVSAHELELIMENKLTRFEVSYDSQVITAHKTVSNHTYIWGSDSLGRDIFIRVMYGARMSLLVGFMAALINFVIGVFYGGIAGYFGGRLDNVMMRVVDIVSSIPMMLYVILIMVVLGPGLQSIILAMSVTYWVDMARIVRAQVLSLREQEFVMAAQLLGASTKRILIKHLIPNVMGPVMVSMSMQIPSAMFTEAFLSFIGLGVSAPQASWGTLCNDALMGLSSYPYQMFYPALVMSITILAFNLFSDGLRDALDPKLRK